MLNVQEHLRYFVDPASRYDSRTKRALVYKDYRSDEVANFRECGTIIDVKGWTIVRQCPWWVSDTGNYFRGAAANPPYLGVSLIGILPDGVTFVLGREDYSGRGMTADNILLHGVDFSDQRNDPVRSASITSKARVRTWFRAAPWAVETFPGRDDSPAVVQAKLQQAMNAHRLRVAEIEVVQEAIERNWIDDLDDLDYTLPTVEHDYAVNATVFSPAAGLDPANATNRDEVDASLQARTGATQQARAFLAHDLMISTAQGWTDLNEKVQDSFLASSVRGVINTYGTPVSINESHAYVSAVR